MAKTATQSRSTNRSSTKNTKKKTGGSKKKTTSTSRKSTASTKTPRSSANSSKMVYYFGKTRAEGDESMKWLLGGKGANLAEMTSIGLPVPPGFTITTEACASYYDHGRKLPKGLMEDVDKAVKTLEKETGKKFGDDQNPLLVSVRSGAAVSMPGMMDTVLNLGLNDKSVKGLAKLSEDERFAYDAYRRLLNMYGEVVLGVEHKRFEAQFNKLKKRHHASVDTEVDAQGMKELCESYKAVIKKNANRQFPQDPLKQLELGIEAVFGSWNTERAIRYRQINEIAGLKGTAVNVQTMAFGNLGDDSGTGVAFTRNPSTGENRFYGEFLVNAQGEDVVAGIRTPRDVKELGQWNRDIRKQLLEIKDTLESHYQDVQDIEFTVERGTLYMLQTRTGKRTGPAAVKIACDMVKEKLIDQKTALKRVPAADLIQLLLPTFVPEAKKKTKPLTTGLPASPGAGLGKLAFSADDAVERSNNGERVLLVRKDTSPEDVDGMNSAQGILTSTGGMTSHAAVVARGWGKCCVAGAGEITIDEAKARIKVNGQTFTANDTISIDGGTGEVFAGELPTQDPEMSGNFATIMKWADKHRKLRIRTNADAPEDAQRAREFGAQGIGLCRTEHMFFEGQRITAMRQMILAETREAREKALAKLLPHQREDFEGIFKAMKSLPVTVRLLDPPLHEFLPNDKKSQEQLAKTLHMKPAKVKDRVAKLHESNPMLGHRGCRLSITYPEILQMQVTAIVEAAINCKKHRIEAKPEIMIPLVGTRGELDRLRELAEQTVKNVKRDKGYNGKLDIPIGTMIEVPRACLTADEIAKPADFFSFGTNDLTQLTFGYSRDDVNSFLPDYLNQQLLEKDPFQSLDTHGVGELVKMGVDKGRATKSNLKIGICGEHGGDPTSVNFCHQVGLNYVSCSPFRVPIARLAAAQAALD